MAKILIQTETVDKSTKDLFNVHSDLYEGSELRILLSDSAESLVVHKLVVFPKCGLNPELIKDNTYEDSRFFSTLTTTTGIKNFFKLLYGFKLELTFGELYDLFVVAQILRYTKSKDVVNVMEFSIEEAPMELLMKMMLDTETFDRKKILSKIPLKSFRKFAAVNDDPVFLRLLLDESLTRYKNISMEFTKYIESLSKKLSDPFAVLFDGLITDSILNPKR